MKVGYAKRDVTPPVGVRLGGYGDRFGRPSQMIHDPLYTSTIYMESYGEEVLLIHNDVLGVQREFADRVKKMISLRIGIKPTRIFFTTTHTHSGPETIVPMWPNTFPYSDDERKLFEKWQESFIQKIVDASMEAYGNTSPAFINIGVAKAPTLAYNRTHENGPIDESVSFVLFRNSDVRVVLTNYCCHPVCNTDFGISADYPGELYSNMFNNGFEIFFTTGPCGDIDPIRKGRDFMSKMALDITSALTSALGTSFEMKEDKIYAHNEVINLELREPPPLEEARKKFIECYERCKDNLDDPKCVASLLYADEEYEIAKENKKSTDTLIQTLTIGDKFAFISVPGELFVEFGIKLKELSSDIGYALTIISTYSEDYIGYIPDRRAFEKGSYEATPARWSRVKPEAGDIISQAIMESLKINGKC